MTAYDITVMLLLINMLGIAIIFGMTPRGMGDYEQDISQRKETEVSREQEV